MPDSMYLVTASCAQHMTLWRVVTDDFAQVAPLLLPALEAHTEALYTGLRPFERQMWPRDEFVFTVSQLDRRGNLENEPEGTVTFLRREDYARISTFGT